jgi:octaprenyl-diphosphate synthase
MLDSVLNLMRSYVSELDSKSIEKSFEQIPIGKMLRSKLILKISSDKIEDAIKLCSIVELIHLASLLHDDVIDDATTRRGKPTLNETFGNKISIMLGDILYSKAFFELTSFDEQISKTIANAVTLLSVGEFLDVELTKDMNLNKDIYFDMIYKKTASLIEASSKAGAILVGKNSDNYGRYGKNLGIAFQIIDDILDVTQSEEKLGKPAMSDFKEGKTTLPYIYLYERANEAEREKLKSLFKKTLSAEEVSWLKDSFVKYDCITDSIKVARELADEAKDAIGSESELISIIDAMINRDF